MSVHEDVTDLQLATMNAAQLVHQVDHHNPLSLKIVLHGKNKLGFVLGTCKKSNYDASIHELWDRCNAIVLAWIMNNASPNLLSVLIYASDAYTVWEDLREIFDKVNASRVAYLHKEIATLTQGVSSFLTRLNDSYENAKKQVLMTMPLPNLNQDYAMSINDESQRINGKSVHGSNDVNEAAAMMSAKDISGRIASNCMDIQLTSKPRREEETSLLSSTMEEIMGVNLQKLKIMPWEALLSELFSGKVLRIGKEELSLYILKAEYSTVCPIVKQPRLPFHHSSSCSTSVFDLVHADVWALKNFLAMVTNQFRASIKCLITDTGTEFMNDQVTTLLQNIGILHQSSSVYTPQQNGAIERRLPTALLQGKTHFEALYQKVPSTNILEYLGAYVIPLKDVVFKEDIFPFKNMKFGVPYLFPVLEFTDFSPTYKDAQQLSSNYITHIIQSYPLTLVSDDPSASVPAEILIDYSTPPTVLRRSSRPSKPLVWLTNYVVQPQKATCSYPISQYVAYNQLSFDYQASLASYSAIAEPNSFSEASVDPKWVEAMQAEISALEENNT
ncbi:uncharacterized protein LOC142164958 [Nicotiana tabacum]|uniref:Uncharacterized protein LOC142164958 n=1 Tax=Nicotiana tabacum TaxID=4097 RepID=A0AC58S426_TOBAC